MKRVTAYGICFLASALMTAGVLGVGPTLDALGLSIGAAIDYPLIAMGLLLIAFLWYVVSGSEEL